nr:hypothetical protein [Tanacetum cinerariifolium]
LGDLPAGDLGDRAVDAGAGAAAPPAAGRAGAAGRGDRGRP